jgi:hypothetical protein
VLSTPDLNTDPSIVQHDWQCELGDQYSVPEKKTSLYFRVKSSCEGSGVILISYTVMTSENSKNSDLAKLYIFSSNQCLSESHRINMFYFDFVCH